MSDQSAGTTEWIDRRTFTKVAATSGIAGLAGCGGGAGSTAEGTHVSRTNQVPTRIQYNPSNPTSKAQISHQLLFDRFVTYNFAKGEFQPHLIQEWEHGDNTFTLTVRDGVTWSNGDDVTAEDVATQLRIAVLTGSRLADFTESIDVPDDRTVTFNLTGDVNPRIVELNVLAERFMVQKQSRFQTYVDMLRDDEEEGRKKIQSYAYKDVISSGPFTIESRSNQQILLQRRDDHPDSDNINFDKYAFRFIDGNEQVHQALSSGELDSVFSVFTPPGVVDSFPDSVQMVGIPGLWGYGLIPQHETQAGERAVRQAIAYVLNREQIVKNVGETLKQVPPAPVGIPSGEQKRWLGDAYSEFNTYGASSSKTDEAEAILKDAGYTKSGGNWTDPSGKTVELPVTVPAGWSDWQTATQTIVDQLSRFGFKSEVDSRNFSALNGKAWPNGDFTLAAGGWLPGGAQATFPYFSLHHQLVENFRGFSYQYPSANPNRGGNNGDITVPKRTGSGTKTVNPTDRLKTLSETTDEDKSRELILEQAWVTNVDLPMIPVMEKQEQSFISSKGWDIPEEGAEVSQVRWPNTWLPRVGELQRSGN